MLPLRLAIFAAIFGIALSGLFYLLGNLSEPELLRSKKVIVVKGCDSLDTENAARLCPQLYCQKYLLDTKAVELRYRFDVSVDRHASDGVHLIGGVAQPYVRGKDGKFPNVSFACELEGTKVTAGQIVTAAELQDFAAGKLALSP